MCIPRPRSSAFIMQAGVGSGLLLYWSRRASELLLCVPAQGRKSPFLAPSLDTSLKSSGNLRITKKSQCTRGTSHISGGLKSFYTLPHHFSLLGPLCAQISLKHLTSSSFSLEGPKNLECCEQKGEARVNPPPVMVLFSH